MKEKSAQIAIGGVFSALCLLFMFMSAVVPLASFAMPMLAGAALAVVVVENGAKTAVLVYISVSILSVFIVPDLDAKLLFIAFFGYYPVVEPHLDKISQLWLRLGSKLLIFNASMIAWYVVSIQLTGTDEALAEIDAFREWLPVFCAGLNFTFLVYDIALRRYTKLYLNWFRPVFLKR